jgi:hypothetical protein
VFKLTFIQFNPHTPLPFQSYFQTSREEDVSADLLYCANSSTLKQSIKQSSIGEPHQRSPLVDPLQATKEIVPHGVGHWNRQLKCPLYLSICRELTQPSFNWKRTIPGVHIVLHHLEEVIEAKLIDERGSPPVLHPIPWKDFKFPLPGFSPNP